MVILQRIRGVFAAATPLALFLAGTVVLALWLGYQALDAAMSHRRTAEAVLSDYARISATEMAGVIIPSPYKRAAPNKPRMRTRL